MNAKEFIADLQERQGVPPVAAPPGMKKFLSNE